MNWCFSLIPTKWYLNKVKGTIRWEAYQNFATSTALGVC